MSVTFTTTLPDEDQPVLGNGVEDEVSVDRESAPTNYGDVRIQIRETGQSSWDGTSTGFAEFIGAFDTLTMEFVGREDGEEYEVRARTETEHVTGAWTSPVSIITQFPGATAVQISSVGSTSVTPSWTDNSDNEDGFDIEQRRIYDSGPGPWSVAKTVAPNTTSTTLDTVAPDTTYQFRVRAFTEHAEATSGTVETTTDDIGLDRSTVPARGWHVELDHPTGRTVTPDVRDGVQFAPALNDLPRVTIPVRRADHWLRQNWEEADIRVWRDGERLPIDGIDDIVPEPDRVVITAIGGDELRDRVTTAYQNREVWLAVRDELIPNNTSYGATVDDPADGGTESAVQSASTTSDLQSNRANPLPADPVIVENGQLSTLQTCFTTEGENYSDAQTGFGDVTNSAYSGGMSAVLSRDSAASGGSPDYADYEFTLEHTIPASEFSLEVRADDNGNPDGAPALEFLLFTPGGGSYSLDTLTKGAGLTTTWSDVGAGELSNGSGYTGGDLTPGTYTFRIKVTDSDGVADKYQFNADVVAPNDARFSYAFPDSVGPNGYLSGPETHPDAFEVVFADAPSPFNIPAGSVDVAMDDTSGQQALALTNDGGTSYQSATNTSSFATSFPSAGSSLGLKVTLGRYGSRTNATPTQGFRGQTLDSYTLTATLESSPVFRNRRFDDSLRSVLQQAADYGNFVFELVWDDAEQRIAIEWTQPGQRTASSDLPLSDYSVSKKLGAAYDKAVIYGAAEPRDGEEFTASHGTAVALDNDVLVEASETVRDPSTGASYVRGSDYELDTQSGAITALASGDLVDGTTYEISYRHKFRGSYESPDAPADPETVVRTIPSITSDQGCDIAALYLIQRVGEPLYSAEIEVPRRALGLELVAAQQVDELPTDESLEIWSIDESAATARLRLGTRRDVDEVVTDLRDRVAASAERV